MRHFVSRLVAVICLAALPVAPSAAQQSAENQSKYRHAVMEAMKGHISAIQMVAFGEIEDRGFVAGHADALANGGRELKTLFPEGSGGADSHARPAIWEQPEKFAAAVAEAEQATAALRDAVGSGDRQSIVAAFKSTGEACKGCHESFREPIDD